MTGSGERIMECPLCESTASKKAKKGRGFQFQRSWRCNTCGTVWNPGWKRSAGAIAVVTGFITTCLLLLEWWVRGLSSSRERLVRSTLKNNSNPIFPIESVKASVRRAKRGYKVFDAEAQIETDYFEGKHQISGKRAYDFLMEKLSK
jgi:hypothetical protein